MVSPRAPSWTMGPLNVGWLHTSTLVAFHEAAANLQAEINRRAIKGQPASDLSAGVEQLICRLRTVLDEWYAIPASSTGRPLAVEHGEAILASLRELKGRSRA